MRADRAMKSANSFTVGSTYFSLNFKISAATAKQKVLLYSYRILHPSDDEDLACKLSGRSLVHYAVPLGLTERQHCALLTLFKKIVNFKFHIIHRHHHIHVQWAKSLLNINDKIRTYTSKGKRFYKCHVVPMTKYVLIKNKYN